MIISFVMRVTPAGRRRSNGRRQEKTVHAALARQKRAQQEKLVNRLPVGPVHEAVSVVPER
jgi:hypothetical protein